MTGHYRPIAAVKGNGLQIGIDQPFRVALMQRVAGATPALRDDAAAQVDQAAIAGDPFDGGLSTGNLRQVLSPGQRLLDGCPGGAQTAVEELQIHDVWQIALGRHDPLRFQACESASC